MSMEVYVHEEALHEELQEINVPVLKNQYLR